ncbi:MAG TPA: lysine 2,3-aminomutase [Microscillaceae bacterium]|nr:lysine 2,3-aminomutase [Microscillaceae bacterium]
MTFYSSHTFKKTRYYQQLPQSEQVAFDILTEVFHFKTNTYVLENLIDWDKAPQDPIYQLNFPSPSMLSSRNYQLLLDAYQRGDINFAHAIRKHKPADVPIHQQRIPRLQGALIKGTYQAFPNLLFLFPDPMTKTCHAYCSYCYRWKQFVGDTLRSDQTYSYDDPHTPIPYLKAHPEITNVLFTGADPLVLSANKLQQFIEPILAIDTVRVVQISTKSLGWWPHRFTTDPDAEQLLRLFEHIQSKGKHLSLTAHFTHPRELENSIVKQAIRRIQSTGAVIRCQGPLVAGINDSPKTWATLWNYQIDLGLIPSYMFIESGHNHEASFRVPLAKALSIFQKAQQQTTGLTHSVQGPVFMNDIHRVLLDGIVAIDHKKFFVLKCLQSPYPESEGQIELIPYDKHTRSAGDLVKMFTPQEVLNEAYLAS